MSTSNPEFSRNWEQALSIPKERVNQLSIRAFRPSLDKETSHRFLEGHYEVIRAFGFKLSSATESWIDDPTSYAIIVESIDRKKVYGGARIHSGASVFPLPVIGAVYEEAPEITGFVQSLQGRQFGELCGLWNSMSIAGMGVGSVFSIRAAIALAGLVGIDSLIALCSVHSFRMAHRYGFNLVESVGRSGEIPYAGAKQIARLTYQPDVVSLPNSQELERNAIFSLRTEPVQLANELLRGDSVDINYDLSLQ
jgi:hypothetical protein